MIIHLKDAKEFEELTKEGRCIIDFHATWCGPCKMLAPNLEELDEQEKDLKIIKIDVDEVPLLASRFQIYAVPTLIFIKDGKQIRTTQGYQALPQLVKFIS